MANGRCIFTGPAASLAFLVLMAALFLISIASADAGNSTANATSVDLDNALWNFSSGNFSEMENQSDGNNLINTSLANPSGSTNSLNASASNSSSGLPDGANTSLSNSSNQTDASAANLSNGTNTSAGSPNSSMTNPANSSLPAQNDFLSNSSAPNGPSPPAEQNYSQNTTANATANMSSADKTAGLPSVCRSMPEYSRLRRVRAQEAGGGSKSFVFSRPANFDELQYVLVAGPSAYNFAKNDFCVSAWIKTDAQEGGTIVSKADYLEGRGWRLVMDSDGTLVFSISDGVSYIEAGTTQAFNDGLWHLAAVVRGGKAIRIYVDGEEMASASGRREMDAFNNGPLSVGADMSDYDWSQTPRAQFVGSIEAVGFGAGGAGLAEIRSAYRKGRG